jgi:hypothetical protein
MTLRALCVHTMETQSQDELVPLPLQLREEFGRRRRAARTIDRFADRLFRRAKRWIPDKDMTIRVRHSTVFETWVFVIPVEDCRFHVTSFYINDHGLYDRLNETMSRLRLVACMGRLGAKYSDIYVREVEPCVDDGVPVLAMAWINSISQTCIAAVDMLSAFVNKNILGLSDWFSMWLSGA